MTVYKAVAKSQTMTVWFLNSTVDDVIFTVSVDTISTASINGVPIVVIYDFFHNVSMFVMICVMRYLISDISCSICALGTKYGLLRLSISSTSFSIFAIVSPVASLVFNGSPLSSF
jgi:hypothetical protein